MFWRDYDYSLAGINTEKALDYKFNLANGLVIKDYRYWFVLTNDRPYNRAKNEKQKIEHYTVWSKDNLISGLSCKEMWKIIIAWQSAGFTVIMNSKKQQSIVTKTHFHLVRVIEDETVEQKRVGFFGKIIKSIKHTFWLWK